MLREQQPLRAAAAPANSFDAPSAMMFFKCALKIVAAATVASAAPTADQVHMLPGFGPTPFGVYS